MKRTVKHLCIIVLLFAIGSIFFTSCTKQNDTVIVYRDSSIIQYRDTSVNLVGDTTPNKQTYVLILNTGITSDSTNPVPAGQLPYFNIANYVGADSVFFVCSGFNSTSTGSYVADLYDATDSLPIPNSAVTITDRYTTPTTYHMSSNILSGLPAKPITLVLRVASSSTTNFVNGGTAFLLVYK